MIPLSLQKAIAERPAVLEACAFLLMRGSADVHGIWIGLARTIYHI